MDAQLFIVSFKKIELRYFVAWTPGWERWLPVPEILKSEASPFSLPPPVGEASEDDKTRERTTGLSRNSQLTDPHRERTFTEISLSGTPPKVEDLEFRPDHVNWEKTPVLPKLKKKGSRIIDLSDDDRREYKRFPHRIEIVIMTKKGRSFRSSSQNISIGGALLREAVPAELLREPMDLVIVNPFPDKDTPSHLLFKGRIVGDTKDRRRLMFYDVSPEVQRKLSNILEKYKKNYLLHKKKKAA